MLVSRIMNSNVIFLSPDDSVARAARLLARHNIGSLPVCSKDGKLRGVVTDRDIAIRCVAYDNPPEETKLREIMTRGIVSVAPGDNCSYAAKLMADEQVRRLPVVENGHVVGMLSLADLARARNFCAEETSLALTEISLPNNRYRRT